MEKQIEQTLDSREVAEMVEKNHKDLMRDIKRYIKQIINPQARQLFDSIVVHYEIRKRKEKFNPSEYEKMAEQDIKQIEFSFQEFLKSLR